MAERLGLVRMPAQNAVIALAATTWLRLKRSLMATLETFHAANPDLPGLGAERLRLQIEPRLPPPVFAAVLQGFGRKREIAMDGAWVRLPAHAGAADAAGRAAVGEESGRCCPERSGSGRRGCATSPASCGAPETEIRRLMKLLGRMSRLDEVAHDHFFLRGTVAEMVQIATEVAAAAPDGQFGAAQFRDRLDNGRKVAIQILEFFDRHGVTLRRGDLRRINKHRLDLFRRPEGEPVPRELGKRIVPGGASGLQIREGPRAGLWWVRLPLSSAILPQAPMSAVLDALHTAADGANATFAVWIASGASKDRV